MLAGIGISEMFYSVRTSGIKQFIGYNQFIVFTSMFYSVRTSGIKQFMGYKQFITFTFTVISITVRDAGRVYFIFYYVRLASRTVRGTASFRLFRDTAPRAATKSVPGAFGLLVGFASALPATVAKSTDLFRF